MDIAPDRHGAIGHKRGALQQPRFKRRVVEVRRERPRQPRRGRPLQIGRHGPETDATGLGNGALRKPRLVLQPEEFTELTHR
jgi:hypothetical protein